MMDMLAHTLRIDPIELRRINALRVGSVTNTGQVLRESVGLLDCIDIVAQELKQRAGDHPFTRAWWKDNRICVAPGALPSPIKTPV